MPTKTVSTKIELGDYAEDMVTGYKGVVVAFNKYLTGCDRFTLQAGTDKDGKVPDAYNFDVTTVRLLEKAKVTPAGREIEQLPEPELKAGGPPSRDIPWR